MPTSPQAPTLDRDIPTSTSIDADAIASLTDRYTFRRPDEVIRYLKNHPALVPLLIEAADVIPRYFDSKVPAVLEVYFDPEFDDVDGDLFATVQVATEPDDAVDRMDRCYDEWWSDRSLRPPDVLVFEVEFTD